MQPLPTTPNAIEAYLTSKQIDPVQLQEFAGQGFPPRMVVAFLAAAESTHTVVSSRPPGGVGIDLIEAGYDLKGFQIKAKSCDWGPMGGFICQLPFLNKKGFDNIADNTKYIADYLDALNRFSGSGNELAAGKSILDALSKSSISKVTSLPDVQEEITLLALPLENDSLLEIFWLSDRGQEVQKALKDDNVTAVYNSVVAQGKANPAQEALAQIRATIKASVDRRILEVVMEYRQEEQEEGKWSGENEIPDGLQCIPFVQLKRVFEATGDQLVTKLNGMQGIRGAALTDDGRITGFANNESDLLGNVDQAKSTIQLEFLLVPDTLPNVWGIYYKQVSFRPSKPAEQALDDYTPYPFGQRTLNDPLLQALQIKSKTVVPLSGESQADTSKRQSDADTTFIKYVNLIFNQSKFPTLTHGADTYYPVCGMMNPHPPYPAYPLNQPNSYKNAVSGDFDLFAFWPHLDVGYPQIKRLSETNLKEDLKYSPHSSGRLCLDFIPSIGELTQAQPGSTNRLQESAELGNINALGNDVAGRLNSLAHSVYDAVTAANKSFHSDEGGRPNVMEMEFPIAVFFPDKITTKALNNFGDVPTPQAQRQGVETCGGLIKSIEDFVQLIIDINYSGSEYGKQYKVILHSEWMMHLFYMALPEDQRPSFTTQSWFTTASSSNAAAVPLTPDAITKRMKDFTGISTHHNKFYLATGAFDPADFVGKLQRVLRDDADPPAANDATTYTLLQQEFLRMAFRTNEPARDRKSAIALVYSGSGNTI